MESNHSIKPEVHNGVSTLDQPSAAWGWHGIGLPTAQLAGVVSIIFLLAMNFGNHKGHVETIYLCVIAAVIALLLLLSIFPIRKKELRTLTAHNKPRDHVEPNWTYDQATLSGAYADLDDEQLRALNIDPARVRPEISH